MTIVTQEKIPQIEVDSKIAMLEEQFQKADDDHTAAVQGSLKSPQNLKDIEAARLERDTARIRLEIAEKALKEALSAK